MLSALAWVPALAAGGGEAAPGGDAICRAAGAVPEAVTPVSAIFSVPPMAAQRIVVDPETGEIVAEPPAVDKRQQWVARSLSQRVSTSHAGLAEEAGPAGSVKVDLQGRFTTLLVARVAADGEVSLSHGPPEAEPPPPAVEAGEMER